MDNETQHNETRSNGTRYNASRHDDAGDSETRENERAIRAALADAAVLCQPRLFAVHGLYKRREQGTILGWGIQFPDNQGAFYTDPCTRSTHTTSTAENLLMHLRILGDVDLTWLTGDPQ